MFDNIMSRDVKESIAPAAFYESRIPDFKRNRAGWQNVKCVFHGDNTPSLAVHAETGGFTCFGCGKKGGDIIAFTMALNNCSFNDAIRELQQFAGMPEYKRQAIYVRETTNHYNPNQMQRLKWLWERALPLSHVHADIAQRYLISRGLIKILDDLPTDLRYSRLEYWSKKEGSDKPYLVGSFAGLVAVVRDANNYPAMLHRTYLSDSGDSKADVPCPKKLTPRIREPRGGAIKLYAPTHELALAEGLETALSVRVATGLPVWATVSTSLMTSVVIPDSVRRIYVMADHDANGAGEQAATKLVSRLLKEGRDARLVMPAEIDSDWNDILLGSAG